MRRDPRCRTGAAVLDGEIACLDGAGKPLFYELLRKMGPRLCAFDILWPKGRVLRGKALPERKALLSASFSRR